MIGDAKSISDFQFSISNSRIHDFWIIEICDLEIVWKFEIGN